MASTSPYTPASSTLPKRYTPSYTLPAHTLAHPSPHTKDIFLQRPLRYMGFTNEVTTATRSVPFIVKHLPLWNPLGWIIAVGSGLSHAYYRAVNKKVDNHNASPAEARKKSQIAALKTIGFHSLATWFGPIAILEGEKKITEKILHKLGKPVRNWPAVVGIASIPLITKTLDPLIEKPTNHLAREFYIRAENQHR